MGRRIFTLTLGLACCAATTQAAPFTWGTDGANWQTNSAWVGTGTPNYTTDTFTISSGTAVANGGIFNATLNLLTGGTLRVSVDWAGAKNLVMAGGTMSSTAANSRIYNQSDTTSPIVINNLGSAENVTVSAFNISTGADLRVTSKFNAGTGGSGNLVKLGAGLLRLNGDQTGGTWAGQFTIDAGRVRLENTTTLASGTLIVDADELDLQGFSSGTVKIETGGIATVYGDQNRASDLRLRGGTILGNASQNYWVGDGGTTSKVYVESASTLKAPTASVRLGINAQLNGSADLSVEGPGYVELNNNITGNTYTGTITLDAGDTLRMSNSLGLSGGTVNVTTGGTFRMGGGFESGTVNVQTGGVFKADSDWSPISNLHLKGGKILGETSQNYRVGQNGAGSKIYVDSDSLLSAPTLNNYLGIAAQLNGSGALGVEGPGYVELQYDTTGNTYTGTITLDTGDTLRMGNSFGLSGGTVNVTTGGTFRMGAGFVNGTVNVQTGGVFKADNDWQPVSNLHLNGGTILGETSQNYRVGQQGTTNKIYIDGASLLSAPTLNNYLGIASQLNGSANLSIQGPGYVELQNNATGATYSGTITLDTGDILRMGHSEGLSGGTVDVTSGGTFRIGEGFATGKVTIQSGGIADTDGSQKVVSQLRLNGGTLQGNGNNYVGNNTTSSKIYIDSRSTIKAPTSGNTFYLYAQLNGSGPSGNLDVEGPGIVQLQFDHGANSVLYTSTITLDTGDTLRMGNANGLSAGTVEVTTGGKFQLGEGFATGTVNVRSGGVAEADNTGAWKSTVNLHLYGGTLRSGASVNTTYYAGLYNSATSDIYVDSASTIEAPAAGSNLYIGSQLNGSGNLQIVGPGTVRLRSDMTGLTYSGQIGVSANGTLRMDVNTGLAGGTVRLNTAGGVFQLGEGFTNGVVYVSANGVAEADNASDKIAKELRLDGGTLRSSNGNADYRVGDNTTNSMLYVDQASKIQATYAGRTFYLSTKMTGSETVTKTGAGILGFNTIANNATAATGYVPYSGTWDVQAGTLQVSNPTGGSWKGENLGTGATVNIGSGAFLTFSDNNSTNRWDITKNFTGAGTVRLSEVSDRLVVTRNASNNVGSLQPGGERVTGTLTFNWTSTDNTASQLDFAKNASNQRVVWNIEAVDGLNYDKIVNNRYLQNLSNVKLIVDPTVPIPETMTIYQGSATQNLSSQAFGEVVWMYDTTGTLAYNTDGTITMTNILPVLWTQSDSTWSSTGAGGWDRLNPSYNTMAEIRNGGTSVVDSSRSVRNLIIKNTGSRMNIVPGEFTSGSLSVTNNIDIQSGGRFDVQGGGGVYSPILTTAGTVNLNSGATGYITAMTVSDGTTSIGTTAMTYTSISVTGGSYGMAGGTLNFNNATLSPTSMVIGTTGRGPATVSITNSTVTAGSVAVRGAVNAFSPTKLTVGEGGLLNLNNTSNFIADANSYNTGRYVLDPGGEIRFQTSIDLGTFQAQTEWNGGVLGVSTLLTNYNNRSLTTGQVVDFRQYGYLDPSNASDRLYLRGGEVRFGSGYVRDARLQLTEDLGTVAVSGGSLSMMPTTIPANIKLTGAPATWNAGNTTMGRGTALTLADGASVNVGSGKSLSLDSLVFTGTGGTVTLGGGTLIHGSTRLNVGAGAQITGNGNLLVGTSGVQVSTGGKLIGASSSSRMNIFGDLFTSGSVQLTNVKLFGSFNPVASPTGWISQASGDGYTSSLASGNWASPLSGPTYSIITADSLELFAGTTTTLLVGGTSAGPPTQYDRFVLEGGGLIIPSACTLALQWSGGFQASAGDSFQIFTFNGGGVTGTFSAYNLPSFTNPALTWNYSNLYTTGVITVVPEPSTLALLGCGSLIVMARLVRRGRRLA